MKHFHFKSFLLLGLLLLSSFLSAQIRNLGTPLNQGEYLPGGYYATCTKGTDLWVVYGVHDSTDSKKYLRIASHNGLYWTTHHSHEIKTLSNNINKTACFYKGDLYFHGVQGSIVLNSQTYNQRALLKWDGSSVKYVDSIIGNVYDMDTFRNKLMICGDFQKVGNNAGYRYLVQFDSVNWSRPGTPANWVNFQPGYQPGFNSQIVNTGNKLYISGYSSVLDGSKPIFYGLGVYDGSDITPVDTSEFMRFGFNYFAQGELYAHADSTSYYTGDSSYFINYCRSGIKRTTVNNAIKGYLNFNRLRNKFAYRGSSVFTLKPSSQYGFANTTAIIEVLTGKSIRRLYLPDYLRLNASNALGMLGKNCVYFQMKNTRTIVSSGHEFQFFRLDSAINLSATVSGKIYVDVNNDCIFNAGDRPLRNKWLTLEPGNRTAMSDINGDYMFSGIDSGTFVDSLPMPFGKLFKCPSTGKYNVLLSRDSNIIRNFALGYDSSQRDLEISLSSNLGWRARRGFEDEYVLTLSNNTGITRSGTVTLNYDNSAFHTPLSKDSRLVFSGNAGLFTFSNIKPEEMILIRFTMKTYTSLNLGYYKDMRILLDSINRSWDNFPDNDQDTLSLKIVAGYDPNDKASNPSGDIPFGSRKIQYNINFQNLGNDTAYNVVVLDTIDLRVPLQSIILGSSSHPYILEVKDNILIFNFRNIRLVDSATNEPKSKGYLRFSALLQPNLPLGARVHNRAHIFFDYNEAVTTNTASIRITDNPESANMIHAENKNISLYPNPSDGDITLINNMNETGYFLYDYSGKLLKNGLLLNGENKMNLGELPGGIYMIVLADGTHVKFVIQ